MMKKGKKVISLLTVVLLVVLSFAPCAMAVTYPEGVTKEQISATIGKTDILIETLVSTTEEGSLKNMFLPELYKDEVLSSLTVGIYSAIEENAESISSIGLDVSTKGVASNLGAYPEVQEKLVSFDKWSEVDLANASWNVKDKERPMNKTKTRTKTTFFQVFKSIPPRCFILILFYHNKICCSI